jgi:malate dehydrogenase (oxaloacetate-decarboxylating)(NADP+)
MDYEKDSLAYHERLPHGKIATKITKPLETQEDLSLAYSPGVAGPCREIFANPDDSFRYTNRGNLVGVISNGTAVLGLGNLGAWAAKPVMEGKAMLFKKFADIDVFDIELNTTDPEQFIAAVKALEPTFGGINLEDIKAPECFYIEEKLREIMEIPIFHDDQHGTAIIAGAAFLNALELTGRLPATTRVVFSGAGAAALACADLLLSLGVLKSNLLICDTVGVVRLGRVDLNKYKSRFAIDTPHISLADALVDADAFIGVSGPGILKPEMLMSMKQDPIIFALANPDPEISPALARQLRPDAIIATGRSDYPNQVNNVLGFPYIFRGALDVRARTINEEMKLAAVKAIAQLAREDVPEEVNLVYKDSKVFSFGREYLIPKPVDPRVLLRIAPAVAQAAMDSGVARKTIDIELYKEQLEMILGPTRKLIRTLRNDLSRNILRTQVIPTIVLPSGHKTRVLKAATQIAENGEIKIILLGEREVIEEKAVAIGLKGLHPLIEILNPTTDSRRELYAKKFFELRQRRGVSRNFAWQVMNDHYYFAAMMLKSDEVTGMVGGFNRPYSRAVKAVLELIRNPGEKSLAGVYLAFKGNKTYFLSDCTMTIEPTAEQLADIAIATAKTASEYSAEPTRIAMLSYSSFGTVNHPTAAKVRKAVEIIRKRCPELEVDGEMQVDVALDAEQRAMEAPFCLLKGDANVLIFPDLASANISYKLLAMLGDICVVGPIIVGLGKPANIVQRGATVSEITNMIYVTAHQAITK